MMDALYAQVKKPRNSKPSPADRQASRAIRVLLSKQLYIAFDKDFDCSSISNQNCLLLVAFEKSLCLTVFSLHKAKPNGRSSRGFDSFSNDPNIFHLVLEMVLDWKTNLQLITQIRSKLEIMAFLLKLYFLLLLGKPLVVIKQMGNDMICSNYDLFRRATFFFGDMILSYFKELVNETYSIACI